MTLEDFFTLTEMKDGLTAPSRVQELVTVMQNDKDSFANNAGDATRQWAAVASTIAATENRDCLDLFIQLDGLWFVDRWLKDAQNLGNETNESFVEESITALLRALEKLHIDNKRSISSGIWSTVKSLLGHKSSKVQERARQLFDSWKQNDDAVHLDGFSAGVLCADESTKIVEEDSKPSVLNITSEVGANRENHTSGPARDELFPLRTSSDLQPEIADSVHVQTFSEQSSTHKILDNADIKHMSPDHLASTVVLDPIQETPSKDEPSICSVEGTTTGASTFPVAKLSNVEDRPHDSRLNELSKSENQDLKVKTSPNKMGVADLYSGSALSEPRLVSSGADGGTSQVFATDSDLQKNINDNPTGSCSKSTAFGGEGTASDPKGVMENIRVVNHCNNTVQDVECCSNTRQDSSSNGSMSGKLEDLETSSRMADLGAADEDKEHASNGDEEHTSYGDEEHASVGDEEHASDEDEDLTIAKYFPKPAIDAKSPKVIDKRRSNIELEYGMDDALEFARQIAQEVEREVEGEREPFCSSSTEKISKGGIRKADSPDSTNGDQDLPTQVSPKESATDQSHSAEADPEGEDHVVSSENAETIPDQCINDMESSQVTEAAQEVSPEKGLCSFDLNQEVCSDEMDRPVNPVATPIPVVSVSRPVASAGLPVAPLPFEGATIGWKGTTRNSAFRPPSPRRFSDSDKNLSAGATSDSSKQRQDYLDFDLNVTEGGDDLGKPISVSSGLPSGESSVEVSQNRPGRPSLDLNRMDEDGDALPSGLRVEAQFLPIRSSRRSPSPASSSSSMQPSMRNFDLNDRPYFLNDSIDQGPSNFSQNANANAYGWPKGDASVISIMGTRVEINRKDAPHQMLSLANGKATETATDASMARMGSLLDMGSTISYTHPPVYAYNGLATGPTMSFSSAMYGPGGAIPYMVDSRGAPVVPQIMASASAVPAAPFSHSPFIMNMTAAQPGLNGAGPSRPSFDLNSGFMIEGGSRDSGVRQLFLPGPGRSMEDHLRNNSQLPSGSTVVGKRKEPDSGWEYPFSYRHQQPPWR